MGENESIRFNLRIPKSLKEKCENLAHQKNLTLSEWIKRTLNSVVGGDLDENSYSVMEDIDCFVASPNLFGVTTRAEFLREAIYLMYEAISCPNCGAINLGGGEYCTRCGEELRYRRTDTIHAQTYLDDYEKEHPLPEGWHYDLLLPSKEIPDSRFVIMKYSDADEKRPIVVKILTDDDLEEGKRSFQKQMDERDITHLFFNPE